MEERIQKTIARAGIASRRHAESILKEGRVMVNGRMVKGPVCLVDPQRDDIRIDGKPIDHKTYRVYILLNKPRGYVATSKDPEGRARITDLIKEVKTRIFPVGRLDYDAQGLILLTNDGDLTQRLLHPKNKVKKTYLVKVKGTLSREIIKRLESGVRLGVNFETSPARVEILKEGNKNSWLKVVIYEGKNHQIKRMFQFFGHHVLKINRVGFSFLRLKGLLPGEYRHLSPNEIKKLRGNKL